MFVKFTEKEKLYLKIDSDTDSTYEKYPTVTTVEWLKKCNKYNNWNLEDGFRIDEIEV